MKKITSFLILTLSLSSIVYSQTDSVPTLLKVSPKNFKLQWEIGFIAVAFKNALLTGLSADLIGIQYKNTMHISIGMEEATNNVYFNPGYITPATYTAQNAHMAYYVNIEPIVLKGHLINISIPVKICYAANVVGHESTFNQNLVVSPGVNAAINLLQNLSLGTGLSYRFTATDIFNSNNFGLSDDAYTLWVFLRIGIK